MMNNQPGTAGTVLSESEGMLTLTVILPLCHWAKGRSCNSLSLRIITLPSFKFFTVVGMEDHRSLSDTSWLFISGS